jgi:hypothetical protein
MCSDRRGWFAMSEHLDYVGARPMTTVLLASRRGARALQNDESQTPAPNRQ